MSNQRILTMTTDPTAGAWWLAQAGEGPVFSTESQPGGAAPPAQPAPGTGGTGGPRPGGLDPIFLIFIVLAVFVVFTMMGGRREKRRREAMLRDLARNDRVQTVGGIIGTIVELADQEVVLRVDEASNTRIRFSRSAVQQVLRTARDRGNTEGGGKVEVETKPAAPARV